MCDNTTLWKIGYNQTFYKGKCFDDHLLMEAGYLKQSDKTLEGDVAKVHSKQNWSGNLHFTILLITLDLFYRLWEQFEMADDLAEAT